MRNLVSHCIPINLANGTVLYSEGIGTVWFNPVIDGQEMEPVEFSNVLFVPTLSSNLFSVLYLTMYCHFKVIIEGDTLNFLRDAQITLQARVSLSNNAFLTGETIPVEEFASLSSSTTLPMNLQLWHHRLCHYHLAGVKKLLSGNLVTGFKLNSRANPDLVCEACKAGKMHADPFPISHSKTSIPLQLVHSDLHGPLKVSTHQGYRYWVSFIDDFSHFKATYLLKHKSETLNAFKQFKAWAENVTSQRLGTLRDDKGGEYMSKEFDTFCIDNGIQRQHTARNRPQQNGVAERGNRTMEEGVVSILFQSGMPTSFWGEALAAFIHVSNRASISVSSDKTPFEAFYGSKPDLSRLRVWGCTAYVLIQRDKRPLGSLGSHMEKCTFIGYPEGYKAWKFYNPETKKVIISERADFDERFFMHQKHSTPQLPPPRLESLLDSPIHSDLPSQTPHCSVDLPDILDDAFDTLGESQKPAHGGDGSTQSDQPSAHSQTPLAPSNHPQTSPSLPSIYQTPLTCPISTSTHLSSQSIISSHSASLPPPNETIITPSPVPLRP